MDDLTVDEAIALGRLTPRARAQRLLIAHLSDEQREAWRACRYIVVKGKETWFVIGDGWVTEYTDKPPVEISRGTMPPRDYYDSWCIQPTTNYYFEIPAADIVLAKLLLLETNEDLFRLVANH